MLRLPFRQRLAKVSQARGSPVSKPFLNQLERASALTTKARNLMQARLPDVLQPYTDLSAKPEVYVADWYTHKIAVVDATALVSVAEIPVGQSPSGLAVTPDGALLLSADRDSDQVSIIDLATRAVVATVPVGQKPFGVTISTDGKTAYTANVASDDVTVIDIASRKVTTTIKSSHRPYAVALARGRGFVTGQYSGTVDVFDAKTMQPEKAIDVCDHPEGIEADSEEAFVYVACWGDNILLKINAETLQIVGKAKVGDGPRAFGKFLR